MVIYKSITNIIEYKSITKTDRFKWKPARLLFSFNQQGNDIFEITAKVGDKRQSINQSINLKHTIASIKQIPNQRIHYEVIV